MKKINFYLVFLLPMIFIGCYKDSSNDSPSDLLQRELFSGSLFEEVQMNGGVSEPITEFTQIGNQMQFYEFDVLGVGDDGTVTFFVDCSSKILVFGHEIGDLSEFSFSLRQNDAGDFVLSDNQTDFIVTYFPQSSEFDLRLSDTKTIYASELLEEDLEAYPIAKYFPIYAGIIYEFTSNRATVLPTVVPVADKYEGLYIGFYTSTFKC